MAEVESSIEPLGGVAGEWDRFVESMNDGDLVQSSSWAKTKIDLGADALVVVLRSARGIVGGALVHVRKVAPGVSIATVARGPLLRPDHIELAPRLCDEVQRAAQLVSARLLAVQPPIDGWAFDAELSKSGFVIGFPSVAPPATTRLDLRLEEDELLSAMSKMRRRNIRSAVRSGFPIESSSDIAGFHALHEASARRQGFSPLQRSTLESQWHHLAPKDQVSIVIASHLDRPVAALWLTSFGNTVTYKLPGWNADVAQPKNVNEGLHWYAIRRAKAAGARWYDFGGFDLPAARCIEQRLPLPDGFERTPSHFKAGFGGSVVVAPPARFKILLGPASDVASRSSAGLLASDLVAQLADRFRNR